MKTYLRKIMAFINDEEGAAAIEYALLLVMVALAIVGVAATLGPKIAGVFTAMDNGDACRSLNCPVFWGGGGRSLRASAPPLGGQPVLCGPKSMPPQRPAPGLAAGTGGVTGYWAPDHGLFLS